MVMTYIDVNDIESKNGIVTDDVDDVSKMMIANNACDNGINKPNSLQNTVL